MTQTSTRSGSRSREVAEDYFFFLRFTFAFFAAFLFFAIAALLAMMSGDVGTVQSRIDVHCNPITPAQQKKHRYRLTERIRQGVRRQRVARDDVRISCMRRMSA
jgi:hypothetical protein